MPELVHRSNHWHRFDEVAARIVMTTGRIGAGSARPSLRRHSARTQIAPMSSNAGVQMLRLEPCKLLPDFSNKAPLVGHESVAFERRSTLSSTANCAPSANPERNIFSEFSAHGSNGTNGDPMLKPSRAASELRFRFTIEGVFATELGGWCRTGFVGRAGHERWLAASNDETDVRGNLVPQVRAS